MKTFKYNIYQNDIYDINIYNYFVYRCIVVQYCFPSVYCSGSLYLFLNLGRPKFEISTIFLLMKPQRKRTVFTIRYICPQLTE